MLIDGNQSVVSGVPLMQLDGGTRNEVVISHLVVENVEITFHCDDEIGRYDSSRKGRKGEDEYGKNSHFAGRNGAMIRGVVCDFQMCRGFTESTWEDSAL